MSLHSLARIGAGVYCICEAAARTAHDLKCPLHPKAPEPICNGNCFQIGGPFIAEDPACPLHGERGMPPSPRTWGRS